MKGRRKKKMASSVKCDSDSAESSKTAVKAHQNVITSYFSPNSLKYLDINGKRDETIRSESCRTSLTFESTKDDTSVSVKEETEGENRSENIVTRSVEQIENFGNTNGHRVTDGLKKHSSQAKQQKKSNSSTKSTEKLASRVNEANLSVKTVQNKTKSNNKQITEYFPVRRSDRKTRKQLQKELHSNLTDILLSGKDSSFLQIYDFDDKGRGVVTCKKFKRGEFVVEYSGELIDCQAAKLRELQYSCDSMIGCYMYYFLYNDKQYCVDATAETGRLGRLVNHSKKDGNLITKTFVVDNVPRLVLLAKRDIQEKEELMYDYGDRSLSSIQAHPWLAD